MTSPLRIFRRSNLLTECEECRLPVDLSRAGGCARCRRVLCNRHLHGSFWRRLIVDVMAQAPVCVRCRASAA
ncbi:MAG TPA: hypothetical protein VJ867_01390 [Gemmatimonadaceae bacterium]|nr:hypothetical protein [Gemmatimonadaceae bacterium]